MENNLSKELQESLKRHRELLGYNPSKGTSSLNEIRDRHSYLADNTDYAEGDEEETEEGAEEGEDNPDFDFGGEEETEEEGGDEGFGEEEGGEEEGGEEETDDEFGTADEFSAADDIESEEDSDTEEIDVTDIVKRADDAKGYAEKAVSAAEEGKNMIQDLMTKFEALQSSLSKIDTVSNEIQSIKKDIQSQKPKEKLELRSLDSYPFNVKLTDYWNDEKIKANYEINGGTPDAESEDGQVKVWKLDPNEAKDFSTVDIKKSFVPESKSKKKVLINEDFESDIRKAVIEDWDDGVITKLILDAKNEGSITKLVTIKSYLQELLQTDPDADLATFFIIDIDKFIQEIRNQGRPNIGVTESKSKKKVLTESITNTHLGVGNLGTDGHGGWIVYDLKNRIEYDVVDDQCKIFNRNQFKYDDTKVNFTYEGDKVRVQLGE